MAKIGFVVILFLMVCKSYAQQDCLILIDADNEQPFYARLDGKTYPSSNAGHLIISRLKDSVYSIAIGFPGNQYPEHLFSVQVTRKDQGFQLRHTGEKNWALYNRQTLELKTALADTMSTSFALQRGVKKDDAFSRLMASVVNDSLVMYNTYVEEKIPEDIAQLPKNKATPTVDLLSLDTIKKASPDSTRAIVAMPITAEKKLKPEKTDKRPAIVKFKEGRTRSGLHLVYLDRTVKGISDTIRIMILFENDQKKSAGSDTPKALNAQVRSAVPGKGANKPPVVVSCIDLASDADVDSLRAGILIANTFDTKIDAARKFFKLKCVTVSQVKALSGLFAYDKIRLAFYQAAYPAVTDKDNFAQLVSLLSDKAMIKAFNASF
jgi:hypothetical protein